MADALTSDPSAHLTDATSDSRWCGFFLPQHPDLVAGELWEPATWARRFIECDDAWVTQTYLRLRDAGYPVRACDESTVTDVDAVVVHPRHVRTVLTIAGVRRPTTLVTLADKTYGRLGADFLITQNASWPGGNRWPMPHWPQSGLVPRDATRRGLRAAGYKGRADTLHPGLQTAEWTRSLAALGIEWHVDAAPDVLDPGQTHPWADYRTTDVVVALRPDDRDLRKAKPASKLVNAWLAGVPAVLGAEEQYRELRCCELDYCEAKDPGEDLAAVRELAEDGARYRRMVEHGRVRAEAYGESAMVAQWEHAITTLRRRAELRSSPETIYRQFAKWVYLHRHPSALATWLRRSRP